MDALDYEFSLRFIFKCPRYDVEGLADADAYRRAKRSNNWEEVMSAIKKAVESLNEESLALSWTKKQLEYGESKINFDESLKYINENIDNPNIVGDSLLLILQLLKSIACALRAKNPI